MTKSIRSKFLWKNAINGAQAFLALGLLLSLALSALNIQPASAAGELTIVPITWNVIGLDSNNVSVGPNHFPIGARICNYSGSTQSVTATFNWDDGLNKFTGGTYINLRPGTLDVVPLSIPNGVCKDAYYEVEVKRTSAAYNQTRAYTITATAGSFSASTPSPRELFVEYLVSQARNSVNDMQLASAFGGPYTSIPNGGTLTLMVGQTYFIKLVGATATNGYEQLESFINFPNTIFQVKSVNTTYTADTSPTVDNPNNKLYGDGCQWVSNPLSPNYRSCVSTGKVGGGIDVIYEVTILQVPGAPLVNPEPLSTLIYDFSGSSYHYNADYGVSTRYANIINASVAKSFSPKTINPGETSILTFTVKNPGPSAISNFNFTDSLPSGMTISASGITYSNCGSPSPASLTVGDTSLSFSNINVAGLGACTIAVSVTASADATYTNTSGPLYIGTDSTGSIATDALVVSSKPAAPSSCGPTPSTLATWDFSNYAASTATQNGPFNASSLGTGVLSAVATYGASGASASGIAIPTTCPTGWGCPDAGGNVGNSWGIRSGWLGANPLDSTTAVTPYFQFSVDASNYGGLGIVANYNMIGNWSNAGNLYVLFSTDGITWSQLSGAPWNKQNNWKIDAVSGLSTATGNPTVYFRIFPAGAQNATATFYIDEIRVTGCPRPVLPTLSKSFSPTTITKGSSSALTFTFSNPNASILSGMSFTDTLPAGLVVSTPNGLSAISCSSGSVQTAPTITSVAGTTGISMSGLALNANSICSFSVNVTGSLGGQYTNITSPISATATGPNTGPTGYGTANLTVIAPPIISESFGVNTLITGSTTTLTYTITNPNTFTSLTGVAFTDLLPSGLLVADPSVISSIVCTPPGSLTGQTITATANSNTISLSGGTLAAGASCTFSVNVTGTTTGLKENDVTVTSTNGGTGNTANANILVKDLTPAFKFSKKVGKTATGPWYESVIIKPGDPVYYLFTIENTGDLALSPVTLTDPTVDVSSCSVPASLPAPDALDDDHIYTCVVNITTPLTAVTGAVDNTATVNASYDHDNDGGTPPLALTPVSDSATYINGNFGHLPSSYENMNLYNDGGAMHLNGGTYFGSGVTTTDADGINNPTYTTKSTDDGVNMTSGTWTNGAAGGFATITFTCPSPDCYMNAWIDWNQDGDFNDTINGTSEQIFTNYVITGSGTSTLTFNIPTGITLDGIFYSRFRIYDELPTLAKPNGLAQDGTTPIVGEIEDYAISLKNGTLTPITLSYFEAEREGQTVKFNWSTATESGNAGFNLYVETNGKMSLLNEELIPSTVVDSASPQDYSYSASTSGDVFYIEDVSVNGQVKLHGPFSLGESYGARLPVEKLNQVSIAADVARNAAVVDAQLLKDLKVPAAALEEPTQNQPGLLLTTSLNLKVNKTGIHRVTYEMLRDAGLDLRGVPSAKLTLTNRGQVVPIHVSANGKFGQGSYIEFYGEALDTFYTDTNIYVLQISPSKAWRISPEDLRLNPDDARTETFTDVETPESGNGNGSAGTEGESNPGAPADSGERREETDTETYTGSSDGDSTAGTDGAAPTQAEDEDAESREENAAQTESGSSSDVDLLGVGSDGSKLLAALNADAEPWYLETTVVNNQRAFASSAPDEDKWYDTTMLAYTTPKVWDFPFVVNDLADVLYESPFELVVWGVTDWPQEPDHHLLVSVNGVQLADVTFDGSTGQTIQFNVPAGLLLEGENTLRITQPGDTGVRWDMIRLDKFSISYPRVFRAQGGRLTFTSVGQAFRVTDLPSSDVVVYRLDANGPVRLRRMAVEQDLNGYAVTFAGSETEATYVVSVSEAHYIPALEPTRLKTNLARPAEYLVIAHPSFMDGLEPLLAARRAQGLTTNLVNVNDLYAQYSYGIFDPQAIKDYIAYAARKLDTRYVLLVGGDTYDYRNYMGLDSISFIPSVYHATGWNARFIPVDPLFTDLNGDDLPDLAIGRFPVRTSDELALMIQKTLAYQSKDYGRTALFVSDRYDGLVSFKGISQTMERRLPPGWTVQNLNLDDLDVANARQQLLTGMNRGSALVTFTGHSGPGAWTFNNLFSTTHAAQLTNAGKPFVAVQWGCWNTYYVDPENDYLVHSLLFSGDRGAAAVMGAVTLTDSRSERLLGELLTPRLVKPGMTIGQALQDSKRDLASTNPELLDVLLGWTLMGDPALIIEP